eukprot:Hpha_TRINITY_DN15868_c2_g18::TRINITY_DN15868_c2_g18_i1::g.192161::m.192161
MALDWREVRLPSGACFTGSFLRGKRHGRGLWRATEGVQRYEGEYVNNDHQGWGSYHWSTLGKRYHGQWREGMMSGSGVYYFSPDGGEFYVGGYHDDVKHGEGFYRYAKDARVTLQQWSHGELVSERSATPVEQVEAFAAAIEMRVQCESVAPCPVSEPTPVSELFDRHLRRTTVTLPSGAEYCGEALQCMKHGKGSWRHPAGDCYDGDFVRNHMAGWGMYRVGEKRYVGSWEASKMHGWGVYFFTTTDDEFYVGPYWEDKRSGAGVYFFASGGAQKQIWSNGVLVDEYPADSSTRKQYLDAKAAICGRLK